MAHVLNQKDRSYAFWKFLFFFLISTALIVGAVYFDILIPAKETDNLREQVFRYRNQERIEENFAKTMEDTRLLIDSLTKPGTDIGYLKGDIDAKIRDMNNRQYNDSSVYGRMNKNTRDILALYKNTTLMNVRIQADLEKYTNDYKTCSTALEKANDRLLQLTSPKMPQIGYGPN